MTQSQSANLQSLVVVDAARAGDCAKWLTEVNRSIHRSIEALGQCLHASMLTGEIFTHCFEVLEDRVRGFTRNFAHGLDECLSCVGEDVRWRFEPCAKAILREAIDFLMVAKARGPSAQMIGDFSDSFIAVSHVFQPELKNLRELLLLPAGGAVPKPGTRSLAGSTTPKKRKLGRHYKNKALDDVVAAEWDTGKYRDRFEMRDKSSVLRPLLAKEPDGFLALRKSMARNRSRRSKGAKATSHSERVQT